MKSPVSKYGWLAGCGLLVVVMAIGGALAEAEAPSGALVLAVKGKWAWKHGTTQEPLKAGTTVGIDDSLVREDSKESQNFGYVRLLISGKRVASYCNDPDSLPAGHMDCAGEIAVRFLEARAATHPEPGQESGYVSSLLARLGGIVSGSDSEEFFTANVRDVGSLADAVLLKTGGSIDWKPAFRHLNQGEYVASGAGVGKPKFSWDPDQNRISGLESMGTGLQKLHVETTDEEVVGDVWVLIDDAKTFAGDSEHFEELKKATLSWGPNAPSSEKEAILRVGLTELSRERR